MPEFLKNSENRAVAGPCFWGPARYQECVRAYYRLITEVDAEVGRIVAELEKRSLADNTVIVFTSDHGAYLGERGFSGKWYAHEVSIRVPMIVYDPRLPTSRQGAPRRDGAQHRRRSHAARAGRRRCPRRRRARPQPRAARRRAKASLAHRVLL